MDEVTQTSDASQASHAPLRSDTGVIARSASDEAISCLVRNYIGIA
jgi:hypothetical protein